MTRELRNLMLAIVFGFALVATSSTYWILFQHDDLMTRDDNPRRIRLVQGSPRGLILDRHGLALAVSSPYTATQYLRRLYPYDHVAGAVGYHSHQYGADGLERAFDDVLTGQVDGQDARQAQWDELLNRPQPGYDLRTTIDLDLQQHLTTSFEGKDGAAVVVLVPSGEVMAMVSHPELDPNMLDLNWLAFTTLEEQGRADASPLLNRARRGQYQPGGTMQIIWLAAMLEAGDSLENQLSDGVQVISLPELGPEFERITCLFSLPDLEPIQLIEAFAYGCPAPFIAALQQPRDYQTLLMQFGLLEPVPLYRMDTGAGATPVPLDQRPDLQQQTWIEVIGQGQLTVTPLHMARIAAAIANDGRAPSLYMADAYRQPGEREWQSFDIPDQSTRFFSPDVAQQLRTALEFTSDHIVEMPIYGYSSAAYAGKPAALVSWFLGFVDVPNGGSLVVVVVVQDADMPDDAAHIARTALLNYH